MTKTANRIVRLHYVQFRRDEIGMIAKGFTERFPNSGARYLRTVASYLLTIGRARDKAEKLMFSAANSPVYKTVEFLFDEKGFIFDIGNVEKG